MKLYSETESELIFFSPSVYMRLIGCVVMTVGVGALIVSRSSAAQSTSVPASPFVIPLSNALSVLLILAGLFLAVKTRDRSFRFNSRARVLFVTCGTTVSRYPFEEIVSAELVAQLSPELKYCYGIRIQLTGSRVVDMTTRLLPGVETEYREYVSRINAILHKPSCNGHTPAQQT